MGTPARHVLLMIQTISSLVIGSHLKVVTEVEMVIARYLSAVRFMPFLRSMGFTVLATSPLLAAQTMLQPTNELKADVDSASLPDAPAPTDAALAAIYLPVSVTAFFSADLKQQPSQSDFAVEIPIGQLSRDKRRRDCADRRGASRSSRDSLHRHGYANAADILRYQARRCAALQARAARR